MPKRDFIIEGDIVAEQGKIGPNKTNQHTIPNVASDTITLNDATQALTNKTINTSSNTIGVTATGITATELAAALEELLAKSDAALFSVTQNGHGFIAGNVLYHNGTAYAKARADDPATAEVIGIVRDVIDVNNFTILTNGLITTLNSLTPGDTYFLSATTAGALTDTQAGLISKPLLTAISPVAGIFNNQRGLVSAPIGEDFSVTVSKTGELTTGVGTMRWYAAGSHNFTKIDGWVSTAPVGADIIAIIRKNNIAEAQVTIPAGSNSTIGATISASTTPGDYLTLEVFQVGSTTPGTDLFVRLRTL